MDYDRIVLSVIAVALVVIAAKLPMSQAQASSGIVDCRIVGKVDIGRVERIDRLEKVGSIVPVSIQYNPATTSLGSTAANPLYVSVAR